MKIEMTSNIFLQLNRIHRLVLSLIFYRAKVLVQMHHHEVVHHTFMRGSRMSCSSKNTLQQ